MRKMCSTFLIVMLLGLVGGCLHQAPQINTAVEPSLNKEIIENSTLPSDKEFKDPMRPLSRYTPEKFEVISSDRINGWQKIKAKVLLNEIVNYDGDRLITPLKKDQIIEYSIHIPANWTLSDTVLFNSEKRKVAELFPVVLLKLDQQSAFLNFDTYAQSELLLKDIVEFDNYGGVRSILRVSHNGRWYAYNYYLTDGTYGFGLSLYSYSENIRIDEQQLFDQIAGTFHIEKQPVQKAM